MLISQHDSTFSILSFYDRRARRILPALILVSVATNLFSFFHAALQHQILRRVFNRDYVIRQQLIAIFGVTLPEYRREFKSLDQCSSTSKTAAPSITTVITHRRGGDEVAKSAAASDVMNVSHN
jgi:hypothetical protein